MTDEELREYVGRQVEVRLTSGVTLVGRLVAGADAAARGAPYAMRSEHESAISGISEPAYTAIAGANLVESARTLEGPLGEDRLED